MDLGWQRRRESEMDGAREFRIVDDRFVVWILEKEDRADGGEKRMGPNRRYTESLADHPLNDDLKLSSARGFDGCHIGYTWSLRIITKAVVYIILDDSDAIRNASSEEMVLQRCLPGIVPSSSTLFSNSAYR
ncbi:hypothetical protein KM043_008621 [Ampulex compressa]|nr:hypothetical protein KM043_008621 [Ampulex compressa]